MSQYWHVCNTKNLPSLDMKTILQSEASECGLACLAMISNHFGNKVSLSDMRRRFSVGIRGTTLRHLVQFSSAMDLSCRPLKVSLESLQKVKLPCIVHWNLNHFVVLTKIKKKISGKESFFILDPAVGERKLSVEEVSRSYTGIAIEITPTASFTSKEQIRKIALSDLTGKVIGIKTAAFKIMALALALELFVLISPLFNQFVVDEVIVTGDAELLTVLVVGFGILLIMQTCISLARSWLLMRWSIDIGMQWSLRVLSHLLKLPVAFFEKRHLGDVVSRFGSISAIQATVTNLFVESALDGLMAVLSLVMMLIYSWQLSLIVFAGIFLYVLLRAIFYSPLREAARERLVLSARENTNFLETIRAITTLKLFAKESERISLWQNLKQDVINRDVQTQKLNIVFKLLGTTLGSIQSLSLLFVGAHLVMKNMMSLGMLMAFLSYAGTFSSRFFSLVDAAIDVKMLSMHGDRLADIVLETPEPQADGFFDPTELNPEIVLKNVKFRYSSVDPWVLNGVDLHVPAGQSLALIGPSGCGKTTLCKIISGLLLPTEGEVLINGIPVSQVGLRAYRQLIGTVMQDDVLLAGSIMENITFFDTAPDLQKMEECARYASVHEDIKQMPMGYQTLVGDMGSSLSGGQKQRVLLARALYKQPKILALDEATSHLDVHNEQRVSENLRSLKLTRIIVAHRPETINSAERILRLNAGVLLEVVRNVATN